MLSEEVAPAIPATTTDYDHRQPADLWGYQTACGWLTYLNIISKISAVR